MYELEDWAFAISGLVIGQNPPYLAGLSLVQIDTNGVLLGYRTYFDVTEDDYSFYQSIGFTKLKQNGSPCSAYSSPVETGFSWLQMLKANQYS